MNNISLKKSMLHIVPFIFAVLLFSGCASKQPQWSEAAQQQQTETGVAIKPSETGRAMRSSIEYVNVKMAKSIFIDPPEDNNRIYIRVRDTSGTDWGDIDIDTLVGNAIVKRGYERVRNTKNAQYVMQVNLLYAGEVSAAALAQLDETEYGQSITGILGDALIGGVAGAATGAIIGRDATGAIAGAATGAVVGGVANYLREGEREKLLQSKQETKFFNVLADIEIRERSTTIGRKKSRQSIEQVQEDISDSELGVINDGVSESISATEETFFDEEVHWKEYRTRLIGKAKGKLVVFEDVKYDFIQKMTRSISGLF